MENWFWHLKTAHSSAVYFLLRVLGMQASKISLLLDALWKKKKKREKIGFFVLPQTGTYLPKGCYSYLNVKNKTLPWHGISGLPSSERSLAFSNVEGIYFSCFEPTDCTCCCRLLKSLSCWLLWAQWRSASLGLLEGEDHELQCIPEAEERPGTLGGGKRKINLWGLCHFTGDESLFAAELLALVAGTAVAALHCQASLLCTSELQVLGLLWGWSRHRATHGRRLLQAAGQSWSPAHYTYVCGGKLGYFWPRVVRAKHGSLLSCLRPGGKSLLSLWPWSELYCTHPMCKKAKGMGYGGYQNHDLDIPYPFISLLHSSRGAALLNVIRLQKSLAAVCPLGDEFIERGLN